MTTDELDPIGRGNLCVKGRFGFSFIHHPDRLKQPLIRKNGALIEASWEEAIDFTVQRLSDVKAKYGADAIGGIGSARATSEKITSEFPPALITGRRLYHFNNSAQTRRTSTDNEKAEGLDMNPRDIESLGLKDNQRIRVISRRGALSSLSAPTVPSLKALRLPRSTTRITLSTSLQAAHGTRIRTRTATSSLPSEWKVLIEQNRAARRLWVGSFFGG